MNKAGRYLQAGPRENTRRSYRAVVEHFEVTWGRVSAGDRRQHRVPTQGSPSGSGAKQKAACTLVSRRPNQISNRM
jgi:hypothetical protein